MSAQSSGHQALKPLRRGLASIKAVALPDATTVLTVYTVLLYLVPSDRRIAALGAAGSPSAIWAVGVGLWWGWYHIQRTKPSLSLGRQPVRTAEFILLGSALLSYVAAALRPLPVDETNAIDIGLLRLLGLAGVLLVANDGIPDRERFLTLLRRIVLAGGLFAAFGLLQFVIGQSLVDSITIPGLTSTQSFTNVQDRSGFLRSASTAMHPLEYAAVLAMILPLALSFGLHDLRGSKLARWFPTAAITLAMVLAVSRSAILGMIAGVVVLFPAWSRSVRWKVGLASVVLLAAVYALVPGMIGTLRYLFLGVGQDSSANSRTESYGLVDIFVARSPFVGRGFGTFLPEYRILDNQYLLVLIEMGFVGLFALVGLLLTSLICGWVGRRFYTDPLMNQIGQALAASVVAGAALTGFFDAFSFQMAGGTLFLMLGLCGTYWRLRKPEAAKAAVS